MGNGKDICNLAESYQPKPRMLEPWQIWMCILPNEHATDAEMPKRRPLVIVDPYYDADDLDSHNRHYPKEDFYPDVIRGTTDSNGIYEGRPGTVTITKDDAHGMGLDKKTVLLVYKMIEYSRRGESDMLSARQIYDEGGYIGKLSEKYINKVMDTLRNDRRYVDNGIAVEDLDMDGKSRLDMVYDFIEDIYGLRKDSIASDGEFGLGNLVFKEFRNLGYLDTLKSLVRKMRGKELSLEKLTEEFSESTLDSIYDSTLDNDGGTFGLRTGKSLVGDDLVRNAYSVEFASHDWNQRIAQVGREKVISAIRDLLGRSELVRDADAIGTWSSGEGERPSSSVGLDKFFSDRKEAEEFAVRHNQKAIGVFDSKGNYSDTIYRKDFRYVRSEPETPGNEDGDNA